MKLTSALSFVVGIAAVLPVALGGMTLRLRGNAASPKEGIHFLSSGGGDFDLGIDAHFQLDTSDDLTADEQTFAKYCLRRAYNAVHNNNAVVMQFVDLTSQDSTPVVAATSSDAELVTQDENSNNNNMASLQAHNNQPSYYTLGFAALGNCRLCGSRLATNELMGLEDSRARWAQAYCNELRQGTIAKFQVASNCTIDYYMPDTGINNEVDTEQIGITAHFTMPRNRDLTTNEQVFANECLRLSYNEVHDPASVFMETVTLTNNAYYPGDGPQDYSWTLDWSSQALFRNVGSNDDDNGGAGNSIIRAISKSIMKLDAQQHIHWQIKFCEKLQSGPFVAFQSATDCQVIVNNAATLSSTTAGST